MSALSASAVLSLALHAGFDREQANMMTVIAKYESGWDPRSHGDLGLAQGSFGLWQIYSGAHNLRELGINKYTDLYNAQVNAHAARIVYREQGYQAWSTYNNESGSRSWAALLSKVAAINTGITPIPKGITRAIIEHEHPSQDWRGMCLKFVRTCLGVGPKYPNAAAAWAGAGGALGADTHTVRRPVAGAPVFWLGGPRGFGHVALADGNGRVWSTDILAPGRVDLVPIPLIKEKWGLRYAGWSETLNGVRVI